MNVRNPSNLPSDLRCDVDGKLLVSGEQLPTSLGTKTAANSLSVTPASDAVFTVASGQNSTAAATIANGASLTAALDLGLYRAARVSMPAGWTAADITFQVSYDGASWNNLYDIYGVEYKIKADASRSILLPLADFLGIRHIKLRSGTAAAPVNQGAQRDIILVLVA